MDAHDCSQPVPVQAAQAQPERGQAEDSLRATRMVGHIAKRGLLGVEKVAAWWPLILCFALGSSRLTLSCCFSFPSRSYLLIFTYLLTYSHFFYWPVYISIYRACISIHVIPFMHIRLWSPQDLLFGEGRQAPTGAGLLDFEKLPHGYRHGGLQGLLLRHRGTLILTFYPSIPPSSLRPVGAQTYWWMLFLSFSSSLNPQEG